VAVVLSSVYQALAVFPVLTNYSRLNIALTVKTNLPLQVVNNGYRYAFKTAKIDNKTLLALFQQPQYANTTFPDGSFLAMGWQNLLWGHVVVMNPNGTNVIFDATQPYYGAGTNYLFITFWNGTFGDNLSGFGAYAGSSVTTNPGGISWVQFDNGYFELDDSSSTTFLYANGASTEHWKEGWDANGDYTTWSDTESFDPTGADYREKLNNSPGAGTVEGKITATGHGKGRNPIDF